MTHWTPISDGAPFGKEVKLWLRAKDGEDKPIGEIIGIYVEDDFFIGWREKSVSGNINTGLQQNLITHWADIDDGPLSIEE